LYQSVVYCSTIGQLSYLGQISVLGHFNEKAHRLLIKLIQTTTRQLLLMRNCSFIKGNHSSCIFNRQISLSWPGHNFCNSSSFW